MRKSVKFFGYGNLVLEKIILKKINIMGIFSIIKSLITDKKTKKKSTSLVDSLKKTKATVKKNSATKTATHYKKSAKEQSKRLDYQIKKLKEK
jgi:choline-glycine betaine transporter